MNRIITIISSIILLLSCSPSHVQDKLDTVDRILSANPDSAFTIISSIDTTQQVLSSRQRALYNLLSSEIKYKKYIDVPDVSTVSEAANYFKGANNKRYRMRALFIKAYYQLMHDDLPHSIVTALEAKEIADQVGEYEYMAKIYEVISDIYNRSYNPEENQRYVTAAAVFYKKAGKEKNFICATLDRAVAYWNDEQYGRSVNLIDSILPTISESDTVLRIYACETKISALLSMNRHKEAIELYRNLSRNVGSNYPIDIALSLDIAMAHDSSAESKALADYIVENSLDTVPVNLYSLYHYYKKAGDYENALGCHEKLLNMQNEVVKKVLNKGVSKAQRDYFAKTAITSRHHAYMMKVWLVFSLIIAGIIIFIFVLYHQ